MNKKLLLVLFAILFSSYLVQAQKNSRFGFRLGLNYSDIDFDDNVFGISDENSDARIGLAAGFFAQYYITNKFSIQPELQYSAQGERSRVVADGDRLTINLLQLPVLFNFHIKKLALSAGPQVGFRIWEFERDDDFEAFQFSGILGVTYDIIDNFQASLRGSFGFNDIVDTSDEESIFNASGVNHYIQFTLAYRL